MSCRRRVGWRQVAGRRTGRRRPAASDRPERPVPWRVDARGAASAPGVRVAPRRGASGSRPSPSSSAARSHGLRGGARGAERRRGVAQELLDRGRDGGRLLGRGGGSTISICGGGSARRQRACVRSAPRRRYRRAAMPEIPVFDHDAVLGRGHAARGDRARARGFVRHHARRVGRCRRRSTSKSPPHGDFRAMPARGGGLAILKWITSFPGNPAPRPAGRDGHRLRLRRRRPASRWR